MLQTVADNIPTKWKEVVSGFISENLDEWHDIEKRYARERQTFEHMLEIYPEKTNIFRCFKYFNPLETKVVILGQDPYHGPDQATGLCFGVTQGVSPPPSLRNIMSEISGPLSDTTLEHWAKQGVLMLNASLTVRQGGPGTHVSIWRALTKYIIDWIAKNTESVIFVAWGAFAYSKMEVVREMKMHHLLVSSHPSPLSAHRKFKTFPPFVGSKPFAKINSILVSMDRRPIVWN
jgi:uracil-DNA glycosylase